MKNITVFTQTGLYFGCDFVLLFRFMGLIRGYLVCSLLQPFSLLHNRSTHSISIRFSWADDRPGQCLCVLQMQMRNYFVPRWIRGHFQQNNDEFFTLLCINLLSRLFHFHGNSIWATKRSERRQSHFSITAHYPTLDYLCMHRDGCPRVVRIKWWNWNGRKTKLSYCRNAFAAIKQIDRLRGWRTLYCIYVRYADSMWPEGYYVPCMMYLSTTIISNLMWVIWILRCVPLAFLFFALLPRRLHIRSSSFSLAPKKCGEKPPRSTRCHLYDWIE